MNWSALIDIVELINTTAHSTVKPKYTVVTNGTLLTEDKIIFCKDHKINIGLSVDGPRLITDRARKDENGTGAYPMIIHALELLKKHDYIPSLSVTISEDVLRNQATVIDWLREMHFSFGIKDISYNLLRFQDEGFDKKKYSNAASSFIIASYKQLGDIINDSRINRKILSLTRSTFFYGDCAAITGNQIVLKANGDIGLCQVFCQSDETTVGNVSAGSLSEIIENAVIPALSKYKRFLPVFRKSCQKCEAIFACGGGCYWESGDCDKSCDIGYCQYSKTLHAWMLSCLDKQTTE